MNSRSHSGSRLLNLKDKKDNHEKQGVVFAVSRGIYGLRFAIVLGWVAASVVLAPFAYQMVLRGAPTPKQPPPGTASSAAMSEFESHFQNLTILRHEMISMRCKTPCTSAANSMSKGFVQQFVDMIKRFNYTNPGTIVQIDHYFALASHHQLGENPFISQDQQSILLVWIWRVPQNMKAKAEAFCNEVKQDVELKNAYQGPDGLEIAATGLVFLDHAMKETLIEEIPVHEITTIWLPFLILASALRSARMLLLALIPMPIEIIVAFGLMYFVSLKTVVLLHALMMMLMLCTSLSFDYALFTLTRYAEERASGANVEDSILTVISQSGRVVVVSGVVLVISWAAMLGLPPPFNGFCVSACTMIIVCVLVQLTFTPSLLAILPFLGPPAAEKGQAALANVEADDFMEMKALDKEGEIAISSRGREDHADSDDPEKKAQVHMSGPWFCMGGFLTKSPCNVLLPLLVYVAMFPLTTRMGKNFDLAAFKFKMGHSYELTMPRGAHEWKTLLQIQESFPSQVGILMPMTIMMFNQAGVPGVAGPQTVTNQQSFDVNCQMVNNLISATKGTEIALSPSSFLSPTLHGEDGDTGQVKCTEYWQIDFVRTNYLSQHLFLAHTSEHLQELWNSLVSKDKGAMLTFVFPRIDPFSPKAFQLATSVRAALELQMQELSQVHPGTTFKMFSTGSVMMDIIDVTSGMLPVSFILCAVVCLTLIAIWFGSAFIPFKLLLTVVVPLTWTFGAGLYVYEDGALEFLNFPGLSRTGDGGMDWSVPVFTLTFMMGLALDYEIFLFERVREFREEGFGDCEAIQLGVAATGTTISSAGLIMALTFAAQLLASIPLMNQMGFILVFSIAVDTFLVRTVLVPAMLSIVPCSNYWPSEMPEPRYEWLAKQGESRSDEEDDEEDDEEEG